MSNRWRVVALFVSGEQEVLATGLSHDQAMRLEQSIVPLECSIIVEHDAVDTLVEAAATGHADLRDPDDGQTAPGPLSQPVSPAEFAPRGLDSYGYSQTGGGQ